MSEHKYLDKCPHLKGWHKNCTQHCKQQIHFFLITGLAAKNKIICSCCHVTITRTCSQVLDYSLQTCNTKTRLKIQFCVQLNNSLKKHLETIIILKYYLHYDCICSNMRNRKFLCFKLKFFTAKK